MITISLDEQGVFEQGGLGTKDVAMIAGIVYDDKDDILDASREKTRIKNYLESVCKTVNATYPQALHAGHGHDSEVGRVKSEYNRTLGDFLKSGKYKGQAVNSDDGAERTGEYYVYAFVKSRVGKPALKMESVSNLIHEDNASNLYMHMVEDTISRLLFYNGEFAEEKSAVLDVATRVYVKDAGVDISEHTDIGYSTKQSGNSMRIYLTNTDVFRTALEREMMVQEGRDLTIKSLAASSINYNDASAGHEFLYMADAICSCIGYQVSYGTGNQYISKLWNKMNQLTGKNKLLFVYDIVDSLYVKAWDWIKRGDIYQGLSELYECLNCNSDAASFYKQVWERVLLERVKNQVDTASFMHAVRKLSQSVRKNNLNQDKLIYLFKNLEQLVPVVEFSNEQDRAVLYELYDAGVAAYNHVGQAKMAETCMEQGKVYARFIGVERQLRNRNKAVVALCDAFRYEEAEKVALSNYQYYKKIAEIQKEVFGYETYVSTDYGIICSQLAQCYAHMNDDRAEMYFHEALSALEKGTPDYFITESYLLHFYADCRDKENYEKYAVEYFGNCEDLEQQLVYIAKEGSKEKNALISLRFALFLYVKGIYTFYLDELGGELANKILHLQDTLKQIDADTQKHFQGHPWEIIDKYLAMVAFSMKDTKMVNEYLSLLEKCPGNGGILEIIKKYGSLKVAQLRNDKGKVAKLIQSIENLLITENPELKGKLDHTVEGIERVVSYMYR